MGYSCLILISRGNQVDYRLPTPGRASFSLPSELVSPKTSDGKPEGNYVRKKSSAPSRLSDLQGFRQPIYRRGCGAIICISLESLGVMCVLVSHLDGVGNRLTLIVFVLPKETLAMACRHRAISWVPGGNRVVWIEKGWGTCHKWYPPHQWHACSGSSL